MSIVFYAPKEINCGVCFVNYTPEFLQSKPNYTFVFGDNLQRIGNSGQAIIRNEPNSVGVATKRSPSHTKDAYMTGTEADFSAVDADLLHIESLIESGSYVIFPSGGLGTGLSRLQTHAPKLLSYIDYFVSNLIKTNYEMVRRYIR
jgi:hypothetical protein